MKIAYVHAGHVPSQSANSVHVMKMCSALATEGATITLFCPKAEMKGDPFDMYGVPRNFRIYYVATDRILSKIPFIKGLCTAYSMADAVKKSGCDYVFGRSSQAIYFLRKYKPYIYESHLLPPKKHTLFVEKAIMQGDNFLKHIVITERLKRDYVSKHDFVCSDKITVLQDAADKAKSLTQDIVPSDTNKLLSICKKPVIGYLGHLLPGKCMEILSQVARMRPQYDFHVVGGKQEWVERWQNDDRCKGLNNIKFYGYVENKSIPYYYTMFDICILPFSNSIIVGKFKNSNIARWTSPLKLFEAMSYGKPILTTDLPTIKEVLTDGVNCLMESESNIEGWCHKLDTLVSNEILRAKLGESAKSLFENNYTWSIRARKIIDIFINSKK